MEFIEFYYIVFLYVVQEVSQKKQDVVEKPEIVNYQLINSADY